MGSAGILPAVFSLDGENQKSRQDACASKTGYASLKCLQLRSGQNRYNNDFLQHLFSVKLDHPDDTRCGTFRTPAYSVQNIGVAGVAVPDS